MNLPKKPTQHTMREIFYFKSRPLVKVKPFKLRRILPIRIVDCCSKKGINGSFTREFNRSKKTALAAWIARGDHQHFVIKRHKEASRLLSSENIEKMKSEARMHLGKHYDLTFEWSDDRIYCSELVYKVYLRGAGISLGTLQKLKEFNLKAPAVRRKLTERYGSQIPLNETVISPGSIFEDPILRTVFRNHT